MQIRCSRLRERLKMPGRADLMVFEHSAGSVIAYASVPGSNVIMFHAPGVQKKRRRKRAAAEQAKARRTG
jgi:hypothetical protein